MKKKIDIGRLNIYDLQIIWWTPKTPWFYGKEFYDCWHHWFNLKLFAICWTNI